MHVSHSMLHLLAARHGKGEEEEEEDDDDDSKEDDQQDLYTHKSKERCNLAAMVMMCALFVELQQQQREATKPKVSRAQQNTQFAQLNVT